MKVVYEDNHIIIVYKESGEIVQGDKTGDTTLLDTVKEYIKKKYNKPGNVFLGVVHRLDRPVCGLVVFARTSKSLTRLNEMFRKGEVKKTYWAIVYGCPKNKNATLEGWITRNEAQNKSYFSLKEKPRAKYSSLSYSLLFKSDNYSLLEINLQTGRHHQIRCQLSSIGCPIKGDLKYGARRSNKNGSISLLSRSIDFIHPVSKQPISIVAPVPNENLWHVMENAISSR